MVRERIGPIVRVSQAIEARRMLWILCRNCGHAARIHPRDLAIAAGDAILADLVRRLQCQRCGRREAAAVPDAYPWPGRG